MEKIPIAEKDSDLEGMTATVLHKGTGCYLIENNTPYQHFSLPFIPKDTLKICNKYNGLWYGWVTVPWGDLVFWNTWESYNRKLPDWSYELTPLEGTQRHTLLPHGREIIYNLTSTVQAAKAFLSLHKIDGVVWWQDRWDHTCKKVQIKKQERKHR